MIVTLLTKSDCEFCYQAKELLDRVAVDFVFDLEIIDLASSEGQAIATQHGVVFAPGILIDGRLATYGRPSERRLRRELHRVTPTTKR